MGQGTTIKMGARTNKENTRPQVNKRGHNKVGIQPLHPQDQGVPTRWGNNPFTHNLNVSNFYLLSQGILSTRVSYNNCEFYHHHIRKVQTR